MNYIIIAGGRNFSDFNLLNRKVSKILTNMQDITIANGADSLAERYATAHGIDLIIMPANWKKDGKQAGYIRNTRMAEFATHLIAFWDGRSNGTKHMIKTARDLGIKTRIIQY